MAYNAASIVATAEKQLLRLFSEIGIDEREQEERHSDLLQQSEGVLHSSLQNAEKRLHSLQERREALLHELTTLAVELHAHEHCPAPEQLLERCNERVLADLNLEDQCTCIEEIVSGLRHKRSMLHTVLDGFLQRICGLYRELGTEIPLEFESVGHDLSQQRMQYVEAAYEQAVEEKIRRTEQVAFIVARIGNLIQELGMDNIKRVEGYENDIDELVLNDERGAIGITKDAIERVNERLQTLSAQKKKIQDRIEWLMSRIEARWDALSVPKEQRDEFRAETQGITTQALQKYEDKLVSVNRLFSERLKELCDQARMRVNALCNQLCIPLNKKQDGHQIDLSEEEGLEADGDEVSENSLGRIEAREQKLQELLSSLQPIIVIALKRSEYIEQIEQGKQSPLLSPNDPNRYRGRQAFKLLKKEEQLRILEKKTLPRLEQKLTNAIVEWQQLHERPLTSNGVPLLKLLAPPPPETQMGRPVTPSRRGSSRLSMSSTASPASTLISRRRSGTRSRSSYRMVADDVPLHAQQTQKPISAPTVLAVSAMPKTSLETEADNVEKVLAEADQTLKASCVDKSIERISQAIKLLELQTPSDDAIEQLCDLYHRRSVSYTRIGEYEQAIKDSKRAIQLSPLTNSKNYF